MVNKKTLVKATGIVGGVVGIPLAIAYLRRGRFTVSLTDESVVKGEKAIHTLTLRRKKGFKGKLNLFLKKKPPKTDVSLSKERVKLSKKNPEEKVKISVDTKFNKIRTPTGTFDLVVGITGKDISGIPKKVSGKAHGRLKVKRVPTSIRVTKFKFPKEIKAPGGGKKVEVMVGGNLSFEKGSPGKRTVGLRLKGTRHMESWSDEVITNSDGSFSKTFKTKVYPPRKRCGGRVMAKIGRCPVIKIVPTIVCAFPGTKDFQSSIDYAKTKSTVIRVLGTRISIRRIDIPRYGVGERVPIHVEGGVVDECGRVPPLKDIEIYIWTKGETPPKKPQGTITMKENGKFSGDVTYKVPKNVPRPAVFCVKAVYPGAENRCTYASSDITKCERGYRRR